MLQPQAPTADFTVDNTHPTRHSTVVLTDLSAHRPTGWHWEVTPGVYPDVDFSDAPHDSLSRVAYVTFHRNGTYCVKLKVRNAAGEDSLTRCNYIVVGPPRYCDVTGSDCSMASINSVVIRNTTCATAARSATSPRRATSRTRRSTPRPPICGWATV